MKTTLKIEGITDLRRALESARGMQAVKVIVKKGGADLQQAAQRKAPVDTGYLKRSIFTDISNGGLTSTTRSEADYSGYQEFGTRYMAAQPYMRPSLLQVEPWFIAQLRRLMV